MVGIFAFTIFCQTLAIKERKNCLALIYNNWEDKFLYFSYFQTAVAGEDGLGMKYEFVLGKASYIDHKIETLPCVHTGMCIQPWLSQPNTYFPIK